MRQDDAIRRPAFRRELSWKSKPTVEAVEKRLLMTTFTVMNLNDDLSVGSLRSAILASNATAGPNLINFNILAGGVATIPIRSPLPVITTPVTIDGTTERGYSGTPLVTLSGAGAGLGVDGLDVAAAGSVVQGLAINAFSGEGLNLLVSGTIPAGSITVQNNYIGLAPSGTAGAGNQLDGIMVQTGSNLNKILNNVISGNTANGIYLDGGPAATATSVTTGNIITGNKIGTNAAGGRVVLNGADGILVQNAPMTTIGGTTAATRNIISGNSNGMELFGNSDGTVVEGNYIGTDVTGGAPLRSNITNSVGAGILLQGASNLTIGGTAAGAGNVISGNLIGIDAPGTFASNITIVGNKIGTNAAGTVAVGNSGAGISLDGPSTVTIGGTATAAANVISGNGGDGIDAAFSVGGLVIQGNDIGTDVTGALPLGNVGAGVNIAAFAAKIGGIPTGAANIIAFNGISGNTLASNVIITGQDDSVLSNSIFGSGDLGIQLTQNGNNNQPAPVLATAVSQNTNGVSSEFTGTLTAPNGGYTLQFFASLGLNSAQPVQQAEGQTLIGTGTVTVTGGRANFDITVPSDFTPGSYITATATSVPGNTSQFSTDPIIGTGSGRGTLPPVIAVTSSPSSVAAGQLVTDVFTITNPSLVADLGVAFYDTVPAGTAFFSPTSSSSTGSFVVETGGVINSTLGTIPAGQSVTVTIVLQALAGAVPTFTNTGGVTATTPTTLVSDGITASATSTVTTSSDVAVAVVGPAAPTGVGQTLLYQVTVGNNGLSDATGVNLVDTLPAGVTYVSSTPAGTVGTSSTGATTVSFAVGNLASGATETFDITVLTSGATPASINDTAVVSSDTPDGDLTNNTSTVTSIILASADVAIRSDTVTPTSGIAGSLVTFTINVANNGPSAASGTVVTDTLPAGLTFVSGTAAGGTVTVANGVVTAPVGLLASGATSVVTITARTGPAGSFADSAVITSTDLGGDPNSSNNTGSASTSVMALSDVAISLSGPAGPFNTGNPLTYTAVVANNGPSPATNVVFSDTLFAGATFVSVSANGLTGTNANGVVTLPIGTLAANQSVTVTLVVIPNQAGTVTDTATVTQAEPDSNPANNSSSVTTVLIPPSPILEFSAPTYTVNETDGTATITIVRIGDTSGNLTVNFSTTPGNATAGVDYTPVTSVVSFPAGVSSATVTVPVLADPFDRVNEYVGLRLDTPTGGAIFVGDTSFTTAILGIVNVDPVLVGPTVTDIKLIGPVSSITGIEIDTTGSLDASTAGNTANYSIIAYAGGKGSLAMGTVISVSIAAYNPATGAILLIPSSPLPTNQLFLIDINGTRTGALSDEAGNPLNSTFGSVAGSDYAMTFERGTNLSYADENGARVNIKLTGTGTLDLNRTVSGQAERLQVLGPVAHKTTVTGTVKGAARTTLGGVIGVGKFGSIIVKLHTPPFYVVNATYPDPLSLNNGVAVDTLIPSATTTKTTKTTVKAKAVPTTTTTHAKHPHAAVAHATKAHAKN